MGNDTFILFKEAKSPFPYPQTSHLCQTNYSINLNILNSVDSTYIRTWILFGVLLDVLFLNTVSNLNYLFLYDSISQHKSDS